MPAFVPFRALRYAADDLAALIAPPYDVLSAAEVDALHASDPHNITRVDVPAGGDDRYTRAGQVLAGWVEDGTLVRDHSPTLTLYRLRFVDAGGADREIVGVLGALQVLDPGESPDPDHPTPPVLPHERTTAKASTDRLDLTRATRANLSPIWGLSLAGGLTDRLAAPGEQVGRVVDGGVEHIVERIVDPARIDQISQHVAQAAVLIADGHHRYRVARSYRDEIRSQTGRTDSPAEFTLAFVNELVADQLSVEAIHRTYADTDGATLIGRLGARFGLVPMPEPTPRTLTEMVAEGFLTLVTPDGCFRLTPKPFAFDPVRQLDGLWLEETLPDVRVGYQHGLSETLDAVRTGEAQAAVLIRPVSVEEIERTARERLLMPPKSTFFTPKLKTGLLVRPLTD